ncbi:MAG TPA: hypothetical protein VD973_28830 [Symbiobacteriaceae bacterium]|nr:hypothetical protein [Symbiobacteriaceae bacterium]
MRDWLFQWPAAATWEEIAEIVERELAACPDAAAIDDFEAEQFAAIAWGLCNLDPAFISEYCEEFHLEATRPTEKGKRRGIEALLRLWPHEEKREVLQNLPVRQPILPALPLKKGSDQAIDWTAIAKDLYVGICLVWIFQVVRKYKMADQIEECLKEHEWARWHRRAWVARGKWLMRRLLWQERAEADARAERLARESRALKQRYRQQEALIQSLSKDVAEVARRRDALRRAAESAQADARDLLEQARAEVAIATGELAERQAAHARELAEVSARYEARIDDLTRLLGDVRSEQAAALRERGRRGAGPLTGLTFEIVGPAENGDLYRALIESTGGRVVREDARVRIRLGAVADHEGFSTSGTGLTDLERLLRQQVLPRLLELRAGRG